MQSRMSARLLTGFVLVWGLTPTVAHADTKEILDLITDTATKICEWSRKRETARPWR